MLIRSPTKRPLRIRSSCCTRLSSKRPKKLLSAHQADPEAAEGVLAVVPHVPVDDLPLNRLCESLGAIVSPSEVLLQGLPSHMKAADLPHLTGKQSPDGSPSKFALISRAFLGFRMVFACKSTPIVHLGAFPTLLFSHS